MSGQYPGSYTNLMPGHRNQFNPQLQQQQQLISQMQLSSSASNPTSSAGSSGIGVGVSMPNTGNILPIGYNQGNILSQQHQHQQPQQQTANPIQQQSVQGISGPGSNGMSPVGMHTQTHVQQQLIQQQLQMQQQQQHQQMGSVSSQMGMVGLSMTSTSQVGNIMQQQQPLMVLQQQQQSQQPQQQQTQSQATQQNTLQLQAQGGSSTQQPQSQQQQLSQISGQISQTQLPQIQQQQQPTNNMLSISQQPHKEINIVTLSRVGQETVQDITSRFQEIFVALKIIQPTANRDNHTVKKVQEHFRTIRLLFKRMRLIYERCNDGYPQGMEFSIVETSIPYKDEPEHRTEASQCEEYHRALQENQELIDTVKLKNRQLREIIDRTRIIVWEINTMLSMRRS